MSQEASEPETITVPAAVAEYIDRLNRKAVSLATRGKTRSQAEAQLLGVEIPDELLGEAQLLRSLVADALALAAQTVQFKAEAPELVEVRIPKPPELKPLPRLEVDKKITAAEALKLVRSAKDEIQRTKAAFAAAITQVALQEARDILDVIDRARGVVPREVSGIAAGAAPTITILGRAQLEAEFTRVARAPAPLPAFEAARGTLAGVLITPTTAISRTPIINAAATSTLAPFQRQVNGELFASLDRPTRGTVTIEAPGHLSRTILVEFTVGQTRTFPVELQEVPIAEAPPTAAPPAAAPAPAPAPTLVQGIRSVTVFDSGANMSILLPGGAASVSLPAGSTANTIAIARANNPGATVTVGGVTV